MCSKKKKEEEEWNMKREFYSNWANKWHCWTEAFNKDEKSFNFNVFNKFMQWFVEITDQTDKLRSKIIRLCRKKVEGEIHFYRHQIERIEQHNRWYITLSIAVSCDNFSSTWQKVSDWIRRQTTKCCVRTVYFFSSMARNNGRDGVKVVVLGDKIENGMQQ